ncbi:hypothetical protein QTP70_023771 [Hemibagrus guttatus]|uniref:Ig-like domain-containing protein n=1 Tax=Hemibagrus guttatus TaxID=175788 RepID=A0AAE0PXF9_9TELE|nr:hypothetical protein QTP70_023771 [Hemibagrus guttatus]
MLRNITVAAILMLLTGVQAQHSVTLFSQSLCAVTGSTVKIPCTFTKPDQSTVTEREWYRVQSSDGEPRDLNKAPEYSGRVSVNTWWSDCELTVRNVRVSDSGVYNFRFKTQSSDWISEPSGVQLTVTDLQVKVDPNTVGQREVKLTCISTCRLNTHGFYWYRNGHYLKYTKDASIVLDSTSGYYEGSYSCEVSGTKHRSPPVCVFGEKSCWSVTYFTQTVCSLIGSSVDIHSYYTFPNNYKVTEVLWFINEPQDVRKDEEYQGRVQYTQSSQNDCSLRITNLRERDAQTYRFRFHTDHPTGKYTGKPGVTLSVTGLKVTVSDLYNGNKKLSCITTCTLSNNPTYIWYKNGQRVTDQYRNELYVSSWNAGSYSCAVRGHEELRSPAVCVFGKDCWGVTYTPERVCALKNTSIDLSCSYKYPAGHTVIKSVWFIKEQVGVEPVDVREDEEYQGRVQYTQSSQNDCSLRITNLRERDAQTYRFRFHTDHPTGKYTGTPGVTLSVTDLKVTVSDSGRGQIELNCITTCSLSNNPTYIWYKNGQRVSECKSASCSVAAVGGVVSYSCAVEGHDSLLSPPVYSPKNTSAVVLPSGDTVEGGSVTLSCSSDANPPVLSYSWFKQSAAADTLLTTGQNYSISNISSQHSGLYYCTAHNQLGHHNSTPTHLDVLYSPRNTRAVVLPSGDTVEGDSVTLSCSSDANPPVSNYTWFKQSAAADTVLTTGQNYSISNISSQHSGLYYCTAHNQLGHHSSTPTHLDVLGSDNTVLMFIMVGLFVFLALTLIPGALWMWKRKRSSANGHSSTGENGQPQSDAVYENISASNFSRRVASGDQDDVHYASVIIKRSPTQEVSLSPRHPPDTTEEEDVQYAAVNVSRSTAAIQITFVILKIQHQRNSPRSDYETRLCVGGSGVQAQHSVTLFSQSLCAVTGSTVKIPCTFTKPDQSTVTEGEWYRVQSSDGEPRDLNKDPEYSGRVSVSTWWSDCELTVRNVRVSDSGVYYFRFKTQSSDWISEPSGVQLTVTDLQVKVDPNTVGQREVNVTCSSTCRLNTHSFSWYRNGYYIKYTYDASIVLDSTSGSDEGSYSCEVYEYEHRSPPVCKCQNTSSSSSRWTRGVPRPVERHSLSSVSWVFPRVSSRCGMPGTPSQGDVLEASGTDAQATSTVPFRCGGAAALLRAPPG